MTEYMGDPKEVELRFASSMRERREALGMSQADLLKLLKDRGFGSLHQTTLSRIENGERPARLGEATAISGALKVPLLRLISPLANAAAITGLLELMHDHRSAMLELAGAAARMETLRSSVSAALPDAREAIENILEDPTTDASLAEALDQTRSTIAEAERIVSLSTNDVIAHQLNMADDDGK